MGKSVIPTIKTLMSAFPLHVDGQTPLAEAERLMAEKQIHHIVITRDDGSYGLLSDRDMQHHRSLYSGSSADEGLVVNDVCSEQAVCADINDPIDRILDAMAEQHLGSVVVLREAELAGIFTTTDICRHFAQFLRQARDKGNIPDLIA